MRSSTTAPPRARSRSLALHGAPRARLPARRHRRSRRSAFPDQADGSLIERDGDVVGSSLIGQAFTGAAVLPPAAVRGRRRLRRDGELGLEPRADEPDAARATSRERVAAYRARTASPATRPCPLDAVTASGSGLDPHISVGQRPDPGARASRAPAGSRSPRCSRSSREHTDGRSLGFLGEPGVNVARAQPRARRLGALAARCRAWRAGRSASTSAPRRASARRSRC